MGKLYKFVSWVEKTRILKYFVGAFFILIGLFGLVLPGPGIPIILIGAVIISPNEDVSKKIFKYEKAITYSLIFGIGFALLLPAVLYANSVIDGGILGSWGKISLTFLSIGQEPVKLAIGGFI